MRHLRHLPRQWPVVTSLASAALSSLRTRASASLPVLPTAELTERIAPIDRALIRDFIVHVGGDPDRYRTTVPPHLFPQWSLALASRTMRELPYPITRLVNAGCRLEVRAPLPAGRALTVRASILSIEEDERRVLIATRITTGTDEEPDALVATIHARVPLVKERKKRLGAQLRRPEDARAEYGVGPQLRRPEDVRAENGVGPQFRRGDQVARAELGGRPESRVVPYDADEIGRFSLPSDAGLSFAMLTGDFNPIHWVTRAGVAAGFGGTILHGFAIFARALEGVVRGRFAGDISAVKVWDARFTRPLRLPAGVALWTRNHEAWIGEASGGAPFMTLSFEPRGSND